MVEGEDVLHVPARVVVPKDTTVSINNVKKHRRNSMKHSYKHIHIRYF